MGDIKHNEKMKKIIQNKLLYPEILWERPVHYYKSKAGKVLVMGGSKGKTSAAILACEAVFRSGTGILILGFPNRLKDFYKDILPDAMTLALPSTISDSLSKKGHHEIIEQSQTCDAALVGPGLSTNAETVQLVWYLIFELEIPVVLDADGIHAMATGIEVMRTKKSEEFMKNYFKKIKYCLVMILDPSKVHRILKAMGPVSFDKNQVSTDYIKNHSAEIALYISQEIGCVTVLKGQTIVIANREKVIENKVGGFEQATTGTGNVLSGIIASFVAQNPKKIFEATATAVYLYGLAGDLAHKDKENQNVAPSDLLRLLPLAIKKAESEEPT